MSKTKARPSLDRTDKRILAVLQGNGRMSNKEVARRVNLSQTPCLRRIGLLEEAGYIQRYRAVLDPQALGYGVRAFLSLKRNRESSRDEIAQAMLNVPEVIACHVVSGEYDLLIEIVARDMDDYARVALNTISDMPGIYDIRTTFAIRTMRTDGEIPIAD